MRVVRLEKKRLFKIMSKADAGDIAVIAKDLKDKHSVVVIKAPNKTLAMIKMREPVKKSLFYIGEVMVTEIILELDGIKGMAVTMGDDFDKVYDMAVIDAACNSGIFEREQELLLLEAEQKEVEMKENAMYMKTMVNFNSMDSEAPKV